jgi:peptide/nickel transport system permease protein
MSSGRSFLFDAPWITVFPGLMIILIVMGFNLFGDALRDTLDPRLRN